MRGHVDRRANRPCALFRPAAAGHVVCAGLAAASGRPRAAHILAWTPVALVVVHYALMRIVGRVGLLGIGITVWYVACVVEMLRTTARVSCTVSKPAAASVNAELPHENFALPVAVGELTCR